MEGWRKFLKEQDEEKPQPEQPEQPEQGKQGKYDTSQKAVLQDLIGKEYASFVAELQQKIKDPKFQKFLKMGIEKYDGNAQDDVVEVGTPDIPVKQLFPTQSQIGLADSLGWTSKNNPTGAGKTAGLGSGAANVGGRIITANGKYVVDGHHRWSQVYLLNPEASIPTHNFTVKGDGKSALKLAQLAIAAVDGGLPLQPADAATDIYATNGDPEAIKKMLDDQNVVGDKMAASLQQAWGLSSRDEVIAKIAENAIDLFGKTQKHAAAGPKRGLMPQTAGTDEFGETDPKAKMDAMETGQVNWNPKA
jgi:hypothetical protein